MEIAEEKNFQDGKELLEACIKTLNEKQSGTVGGNMALFPTVIVMLGEKSKRYTKFIKNTLDDNWNNSCFLQYISLVKNGESWNSFLLLNKSEKEVLQWEIQEKTPEHMLNKAIETMLEQSENIFPEKSSIKMEFIMDAAEEKGQEYYDLYLKTRIGLHSEVLKTFYLMLDQRTQDSKKEKSKEMLNDILKQNAEAKDSCGTTYLLSNYLASGAILGEDKIWQNYRLVADIILLGGNRSSNRQYASKLYNGLKTASYALLTKPTDKISFVSVQYLMKEIYKQEKENHSIELSNDEIRQRLGILNTNGFQLAEEIFKKKVQTQLPLPEDLKYLPVASERELKELQKIKEITDEKVDSYTMGAWSAFLQRNYVERVEQYLLNKEEVLELEKCIYHLLFSKFSIFELKKMSSAKRESIRQLLRDNVLFSGVNHDIDYKEKLHQKAVYECKKHFYQKVKEIFIEGFHKLLLYAKKYEQLYVTCEREVAQERMVLGEEDESIKNTYAKKVQEYVISHQKVNSKESAFPDIFQIQGTKEEFLSAFWKVFIDLIDDEIFSYDFERELNFRMNHMTDIDRQIYVRNELQRNLSGSIRLNTLTNVMSKTSCFYFINKNADYAKHLENQKEYGLDFMLFHLNRTDCIEQIEIYDITKPERLQNIDI